MKTDDKTASEKYSVMVVDDEEDICEIIRVILEQEGYTVYTLTSGKAALEFLSEKIPDMIILDIMMPAPDGFAVCKKIREFSSVPVIMLTAKMKEDDKVRGFEVGADDYITKPFSKQDLLARVKAILRRINTEKIPQSSILKFGKLEIDFSNKCLLKNGIVFDLTSIEMDVLHELVSNDGEVIKFDTLITKVWGKHHVNKPQYLHVTIGHLRKKIEDDPSNPVFIKNIFGIGYQFCGSKEH